MKIEHLYNSYKTPVTKKRPHFKGYINQNAINDIKRTYASSPNLQNYLKSISSYNAFVKGLEKCSYNQIVSELYTKYGITSDFQNNKILAGMNALVCNIFQKLGLIKPPALFVRDFRKTPPNYHGAAAVTVTTMQPTTFNTALNELYPFRSVIFNSGNDWENIQYQMMQLKESRQLSTGHFLGIPLHEYFHNAHVHNVFSRYQNCQHGEMAFQNMQRHFNDKKNIELALKETSNYAANSNPVELFAEEMTERIADSLNPMTLLPDRNPFTFMAFKEPAALNKLIDDAWKGNLSRNY